MPILYSESAKVARLEQRVSSDPSSPLFVPLAEAYRRQGQIHDAERVLRAGLLHHKEHFSARTALGRVLLELDRPQEARRELEEVHRAVPENLLAARLLEEARGQANAAADVEPDSADQQVSPPDLVLDSPAQLPETPLGGGLRQATPDDDPPRDAPLATPDPTVERRVAALRRFLNAATSLRGDHA